MSLAPTTSSDDRKDDGRRRSGEVEAYTVEQVAEMLHYVPIETVADLVGHASTAVTEKVYRHQPRPVITTGATTMNAIFSQKPAQSA